MIPVSGKPSINLSLCFLALRINQARHLKTNPPSMYLNCRNAKQNKTNPLKSLPNNFLRIFFTLECQHYFCTKPSGWCVCLCFHTCVCMHMRVCARAQFTQTTHWGKQMYGSKLSESLITLRRCSELGSLCPQGVVVEVSVATIRRARWAWSGHRRATSHGVRVGPRNKASPSPKCQQC